MVMQMCPLVILQFGSQVRAGDMGMNEWRITGMDEWRMELFYRGTPKSYTTLNNSKYEWNKMIIHHSI